MKIRLSWLAGTPLLYIVNHGDFTEAYQHDRDDTCAVQTILTQDGDNEEEIVETHWYRIHHNNPTQGA